MKLVKFKNGKFAIRRWYVLRYTYKDLKDNYWWSRSSPHFPDCMSDNETHVRSVFELLSDDGTPV